jgi:hypothetical protein
MAKIVIDANVIKDLLSISQGKLKKSGISCQVITPQEFLVLES